MNVFRLVFISVLVVMSCFLFGNASAQTSTQNKTSAHELMLQGKTELNKKEYTTARYFYKRAYLSFASKGDYTKAVECGIETVSLYMREYYTRESLSILQEMEEMITSAEEKQDKSLVNLHFVISNKRLQVYSQMKSLQRAENELNNLNKLVSLAKNDSLYKAKLYSEAEYYYAFKLNSKGDAVVQDLINSYKKGHEYDKVSETYLSMIEKAKEINNATMLDLVYKDYIHLTDSIKDAKTKKVFDAEVKKYDDTLHIINQKDDSLSSRMYIIISLCVLCAILVGVLCLLAIILIRYIRKNNKLREEIKSLNKSNILKTDFIENISDRMEPTLNTLSQSVDKIIGKTPEAETDIYIYTNALLKFCSNIRELSILEKSLHEPYQMTEVDMLVLSEAVANKAKEYICDGVQLNINILPFKLNTNGEQLEHILLHLLINASRYTKSGYINLNFSKKGPNLFQFDITDSGIGMSEEQREVIFTPFSTTKDISLGDGLGLPICSMIAKKLNGELLLDPTYTKGCKFILKLYNK